MKIKFINKILVFAMILLLFVSTISYADTLTTDVLESALTEMFSYDIEIRIKKDEETIVKEIKSKEVKNENAEIKLTDKVSGEQILVNYVLGNNTVEFVTDIVLGLDENVATNEEIRNKVKELEQYSALQVCYLSVAETKGKDNSLAALYWAENENKLTTEIYELTTELTGGAGKLKLKINLDEMANLDNGKITSAMECQITLASKKVEVENSGSNTENTNTNQSNTNTNTNTNKDNTTANIEKIPEAGTEFGVENVLEIVISVAIVGIVLLVIKHLYSLKKEE